MQWLNVRRRLTLWYGAALAIIVVGFIGCVYLMMQRNLLARTDANLDDEVEEVATEIHLSQSDADLQEQLRLRYYRHSGFGFQVRKSSLPPFFRSEQLQAVELPVPAVQRPEAGPAHTTYSTIELPGRGPTRLATRWIPRRDDRFLIQATVSLQSTHDELYGVMSTLMTALPFAIAAALVGGYFLAKHALEPVERMATTAEQITALRLDSRLPVSNESDELGHLARTFNTMLDRLQRAVEELRAFTADAAHELRTPLAVLQTEAEVTLKLPRSADEYRRVVEVTLHESKRLAHLTDRLLMLSRHDFCSQSPQREEVFVHALVADVVEQLSVTANQKGIEIKVDELAEAVVLGDDIQLRRLLVNLLENAVKFTTADGTIRVTSTVSSRGWQLTIRDSGIGIAAGDLPHVFRRFFRADKSRSEQVSGAGLGLAIAKAIAETHGGTISLTSLEGVGTTVQVELPAELTPATTSPGSAIVENSGFGS